MTQDDPTLHDIIGDVVAELNADRGGFTTSEAVSRLIAPDMAGTPDDMTKPQTRIYRLGASAAVVQWSPSKRGGPRLRERVSKRDAVFAAATAGFAPQRDLAEVAEGFGWLSELTALDETRDAVRKEVGDLDYTETLQVIALKTRKAAETAASAKRLQKVVDMNPGWARQPGTRLRQWAGSEDC
jgi:hypothetical protein